MALRPDRVLVNRTPRFFRAVRAYLSNARLQVTQPAVGQGIAGIGFDRLLVGVGRRSDIAKLNLRVADIDQHD